MPLKTTKPTPKCPHCGSIIYSRRSELCGVCGLALPKELLFTAQERQVAESQLEKARQRHDEPDPPDEMERRFKENHPVLGAIAGIFKPGNKGD